MARKKRDVVASGATVLVVDDQDEVLTSVASILEREGHCVLLADSGARALELFRAHEIHLALIDYFMPRMTGEQLVAEIRKLDRDVQIVLQTGYSGEKPAREMLRQLDIQGYHDKSEGPDRLLLWIDAALKAHAQIRRIREFETLKSQILNNVSHEFRTPLHIVLGYAEVLRDDVDPTTGLTIERIRKNAQSLLDLVNDFLHLSELDMGTVHPEPTPVPATDLAAKLDELATAMRGDRPLQIECRIAPDMPPLLADPAKLNLILRSLLSNAFKFTRAGTIIVSATNGGRHVSLTVRDDGIGIDPAHHEKIFEPFFQVDGGMTRQRDGAGIGLTIARRLARLMGGDIVVDSQLGEGAAFSLFVPCAPGAMTADVVATATL